MPRRQRALRLTIDSSQSYGPFWLERLERLEHLVPNSRVPSAISNGDERVAVQRPNSVGNELGVAGVEQLLAGARGVLRRVLADRDRNTLRSNPERAVRRLRGRCEHLLLARERDAARRQRIEQRLRRDLDLKIGRASCRERV